MNRGAQRRQRRPELHVSQVIDHIAETKIRHRSDSFDDGIVIGWCCPGQVNANFCDWVTGSLLWDRTRGMRIWGLSGVQSGPRIVEARSQIVDSFLYSEQLRHNGKMPDWLLMVDSDMAADVDAAHRIVESANLHDAQIMGGLCIGGGYSAMFPTLYRCERGDNGDLAVERITEWPRGAVVEVDATGAAFLLVHRDVYLTMRQAFAELPDGSPEPHPWFIEGRRQGAQYGEDIGFCMRARACGFKVMVDTSIRVKHFKQFAMDEEVWDAHRNNERVIGGLQEFEVAG